MRILVDQDGVLANFSEGFRKAWTRRGLPDYFGNWNSWDLADFVPEQHKKFILPVMQERNLFRYLKPIENAVIGIKELVIQGHEVYICTTPVTNSHWCEKDKKAWIKHYLGKEFLPRIIFTHDKTIIDADILIDDKPHIMGSVNKPRWKQVVYKQNWNSGKFTWSALAQRVQPESEPVERILLSYTT